MVKYFIILFFGIQCAAAQGIYPSSDPAAQIRARAVSNNTITIYPGTYRISSTIEIGNVSNLTIEGIGQPILIGSLHEIIRFTGSLKNITVRGVRFISDKKDSTIGWPGMITVIAQDFEHIVIEDCYFSSPACATGGIKVIAEKGICKGLDVRNNVFEQIGVMAVETQNHIDTSVARLTNVSITGNEITRTGTAYKYGRAISLSGKGSTAVIANNRITDAVNSGIELASWSNAAVSGNVVVSDKAKFSALSVTGWCAVTGVSITGNVFSSPVSSLIADCSDYIFSGNSYTGRQLVIRNCRSGFVQGNKIVSTDPIALFVDASSGNVISANSLSNKASSVNWGVIKLYGPLTTHNVGTGNIFFKNGGVNVDQYAGAINNTVQ
jgi:hypothetical protein